MPAPWKTVRVFISSTFRDMHAERDFLVHDVFQELKERCAKRRLHLIDVDLRWGVTEEEERQGKVLEICLDEIERCRPFFIGLLGERYGWTPQRYDVPADEKYEWVKKLETRESGHSVTALEIYHGVLRNLSMQTRAFFYFRDPSFLKDQRFLHEVPAEKQKDFLPESENAAGKLKALKDEIKEHYSVFENYPCEYGGLDVKGQVKLTGLDDLGKRLLEELWEAITLEYPEDSAPPDELTIERSYHEAFIESRSQRFIGRQDVLAQLTAFADAEAESVLVVTGKAGCGKSAVLAKFVRDYAAKRPEQFVLAHFIGVSPGSTDIRRTLLRLCRELARQLSIQDEIPTEYYELRQTFVKFLEQSVATGKVLLVIDALNQLDESHYAHALGWLPQSLPVGIRIIVSAIDDSDCFGALLRRYPAPREVVVGALTDEERKEIVRQTLAVYRKHLDERPDNDQMGRLLGKSESDNPLYLTVACEEMRVFGEFERVTKRIEALPNEVESLFEQVLERIEDDHERVEPNKGKERVETALSLLECSRHGLLENEMLELLARDGEEHLPQAIWARLYRGLKFYLRPSGNEEGTSESGEGLLDFFHRQLAKAVRQRYLKVENAENGTHMRLASYFHRKADPNRDGSWSGNYPRALSELAHHLLAGKRYDDLFQVARNETFLQSQTNAFIDEPSIPLNTLQEALSGAVQSDDAAKMAEFMLSHARRVMKVAEISPLGALREGRLGQALNLAGLIFSRDKEKGALWFLLLAWRLKWQGRNEDARKVLSDLAAYNLPQLTDDWQYFATLALCQLHEVDEHSFLIVQERLLKDEQSTLCLNLLAIYEGQKIDSHNERIMSLVFQIVEKISDASSRAKALSGIAQAQATTGKVAEALETVKQISDESDRAEALCGIAQAQATNGKVAEALETARQISEESKRAEALSGIAQAQTTAGRIDEALETAREIRNEPYRAKALSEIGQVQATAGKIEEAAKTFEEAIKTAREISYESDRGEALGKIAQAQATAGRIEEATKTFEEAINTARETSDESYGARALSRITQAQAICGKVAEALETAREISDESNRASALSEIAQAQITAGKVAEAMETLEEAIKTAREISGEFNRASASSEIAQAQVKAGKVAEAIETFAEAIKTAREISSEYSRALALSQIAQAQVAAKISEEATETFAEAIKTAMSDKEWGTLSLRGIAQALVAAGRVEGATATFEAVINITSEIGDESNRTEALSEIAQAQASAGRFGEALRTAKAISEVYNRALTLSAIAIELDTAGDTEEATRTFQEAINTAKETDNESHGAFALIEIARAKVAAGRVEEATEVFKEALKAAREIRDTVPRAHTFSMITKAQATTGKVEDAIKTLSELISLEDWRASALAEIAQAQVRAGKVAEATETFAEAIITAREISNEYSRSSALSKIATSQAAAGKIRGVLQAVNTAREISDKGWRAFALVEIAKAQIAAAKDKGTAETLDALQKPRGRATRLACKLGVFRFLGSVKMSLAELLVNEAFKSAREITSGARRTEALTGIAEAQAFAGKLKEATETFAEAIKTAREISSNHSRAEALRLIAEAQATAGKVEEAIKTIQSVLVGSEDSILQVRKSIIPEVAGFFVSRGRKDSFKQLLAPASYHVSASYKMCGLLARLYSDDENAIDKIAELVMP